MKNEFKMKKFIRYLLIIGLLVVTADICSARTPRLRSMLYYEYEVISFDKTTGNASIAVTITPDTDTSLYVPKTVPEFCKEIPIEITSSDNIIFNSNKNLLLDFEGKENITIIVEITFVEQSQVKLLFHATCIPTGKVINNYLHLRPDENNLSISMSNLTNAKKVVPLYQKPVRDTMTVEQLNVEYEIYVDLKENEDYEYLNTIDDTLIPALKKGVYRAKLSLSQIYEINERGFEAEFVHRPPWDKRTTPWKILETPPKEPTMTIIHMTESESLADGKQHAEKYVLTDTQPITVVPMTESERLLDRKNQSEKYVLTDKPQESILIDNVMWQRNKGEQYFRVIEPIADTDLFLKKRNDSLEALPDDHLFNLCLIISEDKKSDALTILGNLPEPVAEIFYHLKVKKGDIPKLDKSGIRLSYKFNSTCDHKNSSSDIDSKKN